MKKIDELGISPWPWKIKEWNPFAAIESEKHVVGIVSVGKIGNDADARLIAAAPEMYECLHEAMLVQCGRCKIEPCLKEKCAFKKWRDALTNASGESEVKK